MHSIALCRGVGWCIYRLVSVIFFNEDVWFVCRMKINQKSNRSSSILLAAAV